MTTARDAWPKPAERRLAVRLTPEGLRAVRHGHPWVFASSIASTSHDGAPGDLAVVFDDDRAFLAVGLWDPTSPIRVRVLHQGRPTTVDDTFWQRRVAEALDRRASLVAEGGTTAYRVLHGEGDGTGALVADRYDDVIVVKVYSQAWFAHLAPVLAALEDQLAPRAVVLRLARSVPPRPELGLADGVVLAGTLDGPVTYREHGLVQEADVVHGQKTGAFLDQRENRARVGALASGRRVLDVFACTGGFSLHAAAGGATTVHSVDLSGRALASAQRAFERNAHLPPVAACRHRTTTGDAFEVMGELAERGDRYDLVVVDPPSFAANRAAVPGALRAYGRLTELAVSLVAPGGILVQASCSSRVGEDEFFDTVVARARRHGRRLEELTRTGHPLDHPIGFPEGAYLKALFARVGGG